MTPRLSIIIPAYNEAPTLRSVIERVLACVPDVFEIIVVDDGSQDGTAEIARQASAEYLQVKLVSHPRNLGKTAALRTGFAASRGDIVLVQDADLEYDPADIPALIEPIVTGKADVVYGSRFLVRRAARVLYYRHYLANKFLTFLSNLLTDINFTDVETGYKAFRGDIIRNMVITSSGFGFEIEVTAKIAKLKCRVYEVPISYHGRTYEEGKKIGFVDGLYAIWYTLVYNLLWSKARSFRNLPLTDGKPMRTG
ncbi:MAG: glycosyltransferase family 2 protein [Anaerolineales bacterium]|nr:glycosyltransferase family 2 protein [Anaerolineales bacterium]